jgi:membrane protein required for colicin V production
MPSYLDLGFIAVVFISAVLSMLRGFTREVLAIVSWGAAAIAAYYLYPYVLPYVSPYVSKANVAAGLSAALVFFVALVVVSIVTVKVSDAILDSKVGALDRSLGFLFGVARGYLLCVIAFVFFAWLVPTKSYPIWVQNSKTRGWLEATGNSLESLLPDDLDSQVSKLLNRNKGASGSNGGDSDGDRPAAPIPPDHT